MKKFEQVLKEKAHLRNIRNAKKTIPTQNKTATKMYSKNTDQVQLLLQLYQKKQFDSIPVYKLLRTQNLQQYAKGFIIRGYGISLGKLALLNQDQKKKLYEELKVLPGHTVKLDKIINTIIKQSYGQEGLVDSQMSGLTEMTRKSTHKKENALNRYSSKPEKKRSVEQDVQYQEQLNRILNQYTPTLQTAKQPKISTNSRINSSNLGLSHTSATHNRPQKRISAVLSTADKQRKINNKNKNLPPKMTQTDFRRTKPTPDPSTKSTIRKGQTDQKQNVEEFNSSEILARLLKGVTSGNKIESKNVMQIDLEYGKIKDMYRSFDGAMMSSTIANLDIQELVYAFAGLVQDIVIAAPQPSSQIEKDDQKLQLNLNFHKKQSQNVQDDSKIQEDIGSILRESYMHPLYRENVTQQIQCDQVNSQGEHSQQQQETGRPFQNSLKVQNKGQYMIESSFLGGQSFQFGMQISTNIYNEPQPTQIDYFKPTVDSVFNFIKNVVLAAKMQRQIPVMAAAYLLNFLQKSNIILTSLNYKRLLVTCLLLASKIWDDQSFESPSFAKTFPEYSTILLNQMQKQLLKYLQYKTKLDKKQYALIYFRLRKYIKKNIKSYQNRKLTIKKIRQLQNGDQKQYRTNHLVKKNSF